MPNKAFQLFIFPYAGGSIASFKRLTALLDETVDVITVEYSGRGTRAKEALASSFDELFEDAARYVRERRDMDIPFCLMGYSMGSILAYEMAVQEKISGDLKHLFISAEVSPKRRALELRQVKDPTEEMILERARQLGGLDERMLSNRRFREIYLQPMLSDYRLFFEYRFIEPANCIRTNATFFYCEMDTAFQDVKGWEQLIEGHFDYHEMGNNHFFINQYAFEMANVMNRHFQDLLNEGER